MIWFGWVLWRIDNCRLFKAKSSLYIYYHHHVMPQARISLTSSHHFSLSFIASGMSQGCNPYTHIAAVCMFELVLLLLNGHMRRLIGVHPLWACSSFSSWCLICLVHLTWIVFMMGCRWSYSWYIFGVLPLGLDQYCSQHSCVITVKLLLQPFC